MFNTKITWKRLGSINSAQILALPSDFNELEFVFDFKQFIVFRVSKQLIHATLSEGGRIAFSAEYFDSGWKAVFLSIYVSPSSCYLASAADASKTDITASSFGVVNYR